MSYFVRCPRGEKTIIHNSESNVLKDLNGVWSGLVRSGPVRSVPIEFPRRFISVNPRIYNYEFPCKCISVNHISVLVLA